jgi:hypothetical protein
MAFEITRYTHSMARGIAAAVARSPLSLRKATCRFSRDPLAVRDAD